MKTRNFIYPPGWQPLRILAYLVFLFLALGVKAQTTNALPPLAPASPEIPPTSWEKLSWIVERHSGAFMAGIPMALLAIGLGVWLVLKSKPQPALAPEIMARQALEKLRGRPEDGNLLSDVSRILRQYIAASFQLPAGELSTAEAVAALARQERVDPNLNRNISNFLNECDERKFSPHANATPLDAITRTLEFVAQIGQARQAS